MDVIGPFVAPYDEYPDSELDSANSANYFNSRRLSICGGSNELQHNIIPKQCDACDSPREARSRGSIKFCRVEVEETDFELSDEQRLLKESVDGLLTNAYDFERRKEYMKNKCGWSRAIWRRLAEQGLLASPLIERVVDEARAPLCAEAVGLMDESPKSPSSI